MEFIFNEVSIPLEQGSVLRQTWKKNFKDFLESQSLWNRAVSYDGKIMEFLTIAKRSQSLWNRAVSYDGVFIHHMGSGTMVSIPLEQGSVLRHDYKSVRHVKEVSIPLEQGSVLRRDQGEVESIIGGLNPFGTGQCLTTT